MHKFVDLFDKLICDLFLIKRNEEIWENINFLMEEFNNILSDIVCEEADL